MVLSRDAELILGEFYRRGIVKAGHGLPVNAIDTIFDAEPAFDKRQGLGELVAAGILEPDSRGSRYSLTETGAALFVNPEESARKPIGF